MKYKDISRTELLKYMPATIKWVEAYDSSLTDTEIILRDTDHAYESLRFELSNHQAQNNSIWVIYITMWQHIVVYVEVAMKYKLTSMMQEPQMLC